MTAATCRTPHGRRTSAECPTNNLNEAFISEIEIPIAEIDFDLTPWIEKGFNVGVVRQAEMAWCFLFDCLKKDSLKTMARHAGSPSKAFRVLNDHFLPLSQSQIRVQEEKLKSLRMRSNETPATFFASIRETLGVLQMLGVKKDDREVCNLMLEGLSHECKTLFETLVVFCPNDPPFIETKVRERYLDLQAQGGSKKYSSVALVSMTERKSSKKHNNKPKSNSEFDSSKKKTFQGKCFKCGEKGHLRKDCLARIMAYLPQTGKSEADEDESGEKSDVSYLECLLARRNGVIVQACEELGSMMFDISGLKHLLVSRDDLTLSTVNKDMIMNAVNKSKYFEDWYGDTGTAFHMTDSLACMKDLKSCQKNGGGVSCEVELSGTLKLVLMTADSEFSVELKNVSQLGIQPLFSEGRV